MQEKNLLFFAFGIFTYICMLYFLFAAMDVKIEKSWKDALSNEFWQPYFSEIKQFLLQEKAQWKTIYPSGSNIFSAFDATPFADVKVVALGQDPYHGPWQAHWLSFSVPDGISQPPSLKNIFKELHDDCAIHIPRSWNLLPWAKQWVLLLNAFLTVRAGEPASHQKIWRERFTDAVIRILSAKKEGIVFVFWWAFAQSKEQLVDTSRHFVLKAAHPSPFSAHRWFLWCKHFSQINDLLQKQDKKPINWSLG